MGSGVAVRQVLRYAVRNVNYAAFVPVQFRRCCFQPLGIKCRLFCSSITQTSSPAAQHGHERGPQSGKAGTELSLPSLLDMGFTDIQAQHIMESVSTVKGASVANNAMSALTALFGLGLNPSSVLKLLQKCPEVYTIKDSQFHQRIANLRKVGLVEGSLQRVVAHYPQILTVSVKTLKHVVVFLREKCLFTVQQVTDIIRDSPAIVHEDLDQVEYKFQYVYFRMGVKQAEVVKSRLFRFTLDEVRSRHSFLERRGLYQTPDKKGRTAIINPKLDSILNADQDAFLTEAANASAEEYDVFQRLLARECQEDDEQLYGSVEAETSDSESEEEDDEEEENSGRSGYRKRKKK